MKSTRTWCGYRTSISPTGRTAGPERRHARGCPGVTGAARAAGVSELFDVLVVDAFSSDAIPVHLLTRECFDTFRFHMKPDGIVAVHITNRFFDLSDVVRNLIVPGPEPQMQALLVSVPGSSSQGTSRTDWVLMTSNSQFLADPDVEISVTPWTRAVPQPIIWTDDYSNLIGVLHERDR